MDAHTSAMECNSTKQAPHCDSRKRQYTEVKKREHAWQIQGGRGGLNKAKGAEQQDPKKQGRVQGEVWWEGQRHRNPQRQLEEAEHLQSSSSEDYEDRCRIKVKP